jgi:DNA replication protein DnaC
MKKPFWNKKILLFIGSPGLGKTDFFSRLGEWVGENFNNARYYLETTLLGKLKKDISEGNGSWEENLRYLVDDELIVLDDVARWAVKNGEYNPDRNEWAREVFQEFVDLRYNSSMPTIITSNLNRSQLKSLYGDRVASRLFATENTFVECFDANLDLRQQGL